MWLLVGAIALVAAGATIGATLLTRTDTGGASTAEAKPLQGAPPLEIDLGVRTDDEAVALRQALQLYDAGHRRQAHSIFARYPSLEARLGAAMSDWPDGFNDVAAVAHQHPRSALAQLELGLAYFWEGRVAQAQDDWRRARRLEPDTSYAIAAENLLYPRYFSGHPPYSPSFASPPELARLAPPKQLAFLAARARRPDAHAKLLYGAALLRLGKSVSAEREFAAAARLAPADPDARVAAAVGLFDKAKPSLAFSRLGPLVKVFPARPIVRYHLGLMLLWMGQARAGRAQLEHVVAAGRSPYLDSAQKLLEKIPRK
jgi:tetratricopeptide (TPR) repeat protein